MGLETSWSLADIPSGARDAAKTAALREGLSVGEWLTRHILKRFSEMSSREQEEAFNDLANRVGELNEKLEQFEDQFRIEPLREAVTKLHQGMSRLSEDLVQTAGRSAIQLSALANTIETLNGAVEHIQAETAQNTGAYEQHIAELRDNAQSLDQRQNDATGALTARVEEFAGSVEDLRTRVQKSAVAAERSVVLIEQGLHDLDLRNSDALRAVTTGLDCVSAKLEASRQDATVSTAALDGSIHTLQRAMEGLDGRQQDHSRLLAGNVANLGDKIEEVRGDTSSTCGALDHRLLLVQQGLQSLDLRHSESAQAIARGMESVAQRVESIWTKMSTARAAIEERIVQAEHSIGDINLRHNEGLQAFAEARTLEAASTAALAQLERGVAELKTQVTELAADNRVATLEHGLSELAGRTAGAEALVSALQPKADTIEIELKRLDEKVEQDAQNQQQAMADLKTGVLGETARLLADSVEAVAQKQQTAIAELRTAMSGETAKLLAESVETVAQKQQSAIAELRSVMSGETAKLVAESVETVAQKQQSAIAELRTAMSGETAKLVAESVETVQQTQQSALAELRTAMSGEAAKFVAESVEAVAQKQQSAIAELRIGVLDEALRTVSDKIEVEFRVQQESLAEWKTDVLDDAVKALGAKLEAEGRKQQDAIAELKSSLLDLSNSLSGRLESDENKLEQAIAELRGDLTTTSARIEPVAIVSSEPVPVVPQNLQPVAAVEHAASETATGEILELNAPLAPEPAHADTSAPQERNSSPLPPFPTPVLPHSDPIGLRSGAGADALQPAAAFARDDATAQPSQPSSYLSSARQSLQAAAVHGDSESSSKDLFGFRFFRSADILSKRKGDSGSYALLAGIVLVALLAVIVAITQFVGRSAPAPETAAAHIASARAAVLLHSRNGTAAASAKHLATQRPLSVADMQSDPARLAMLANMGNVRAQLLLGIRDLGTNDVAAAKWFAQAATKGEAEAQYRLGTLYAAGHGVKADAAMALRWFQAAANAGNRRAMFNVALAYAQGQGTAKNPEEAARWFEKAAQLGLIDAQFNLAILYERGLGVPQNLTDAYRWYAIAAKAGDHESKDRIEALVSQLSASDRAAAEAAAAQFVPAPLNARANPVR